MIEGTKVLAITNENRNSPEQYEFATDVEAEVSHLKENYYKWLARLLTLFAAVSMLVLTSSSLVLFRLAPRVTVEPFLIVKQDYSGNLVRYEPIEYNMASRNQLMETFVKQYVIMRNTIISDEHEMQVRWYPGGWIHFLTAENIFKDFTEFRIANWEIILNGKITREVEIISVGKQGGENSPVWKIDFKTYDLMPNELNENEPKIIRTRYWTASLTSYFVRGREMISKRLINPLGFTVVRYSQTEVEVL